MIHENDRRHRLLAMGASVLMHGALLGAFLYAPHPVLPLLNTKARIPVCGLISRYNATQLPDGPDRLPLLMSTILIKRLTVKGFIIFDDYGHRYDEFEKEMSQWLSTGKIKYREHLVDGLEQAPNAFIGMLTGQNFGKLVIRVGDKQ